MCSPKRYAQVLILVPVNVTLFAKRVFGDIIKFRLSVIILGWAPNPITGVHKEEEKKNIKEEKEIKEDGKTKEELNTKNEEE